MSKHKNCKNLLTLLYLEPNLQMGLAFLETWVANNLPDSSHSQRSFSNYGTFPASACVFIPEE